MSRAKRDAVVARSSAGFSLIEALAAVALTATILVALSSVTREWLPNWGRGLIDLERSDLLGLGLERLVADISAAKYVTPWGAAPAPLFEGDASTLIFVRSAIGPNAYPHLEVVRLAETEDGRGLALVRTSAPFTPTAPGGSAEVFAFSNAVALVRAPFRISFAYAGPDRVWIESWKNRERLPDAVRITVRSTVGNRMLDASTAVRIRVTTQGVPRLEAQANASQAATTSAPPPAGSQQ